ncbi:MAG: nuclear transport factor 2 family protein [Chthoniobacterales bacterium]
MELTTAEMAQVAYDRTEIADTIYRYAFGLDHGDPDSLASALTDDCVLDFTMAGKKLGIEFSVLNGRAEVLQVLIPMLGPLDTSHTPNNLQVEVSGETATLHGYMLSQHFMPGQGPRQGSEYALLMNRYEGELVRDGTRWRIRRLVIDNAWAEGDPGIITALATHRVVKDRMRPR